MIETLDWTPTDKQALFLASSEDEVLYGGAAGGGKTDALVIDALGGQQQAILNPSYRALLLRRTFPELKEVKDRAQTVYPAVVPGAAYSVQANEWRFPSGARVEFGYLSSESDVLQYQSRQFQYIGWEELTQWPTDYAYRYMLSRLRAPKRSGLICYVRATTNPGGPGEKWVREYFQIKEGTATETRFAIEIEGRKFWRRFIPATLKDNPHLSADYRQRLMLLPDAERQALLEGLWGVINVPGAIYGAELNAARETGRVGRVAHDSLLKVRTYWDLGIGDSTAVWFVQRVRGEVRLIDYLEDSGKSFDHYARECQARPYTYERHTLPHDASARELGTGRSIEEIAQGLLPGGKSAVFVGPRLAVEDRVNAARMVFPRCWFDADKCLEGLRVLTNYRREYSDRLGESRATPLHDWASHGSDAFGYMALDIDKEYRTGPLLKMRGSSSTGVGWMG